MTETEEIEIFSNEQLEVIQLPRVEDLNYQPLELRYKTVLLLGRLIYSFITALVVGLILLFSPLKDELPRWAIICFVVFYLLYLAWGFFMTIKKFENKSYALRQRDIIYREGWLWKHQTTTPFNRVQHVSIDQGPIERNFNLSKLKIFTAGGKASDITVPGLAPETADQLKEYIVAKTLEDKTGTRTVFASEEE